VSATIALQLLFSGLSIGGVYALVALAIVIPYKASGVLNFGQGEIVTLGAYIALVLTQWGLDYWFVLLGTILIGALFGLAFERGAVRPIVGAAEFTIVIATFAVGLLIRGVIRLYWEDHPHSLSPPFNVPPLNLGGVRLNVTFIWILVCTSFVGFASALFFKYTRFGKAMRAVSQNQSAARLMGIVVERVYMTAWAISTAIGAVAGLLLAPVIGINPEIGNLLLKAIVGAVIGGFTSLGGALIGGLLIGVIETFSGALIGSTFKNVAPFVVLIAFLLVRPYGIFGKPHVRRV
jgi:branched-chain amino acid transport system permease protein